MQVRYLLPLVLAAALQAAETPSNALLVLEKAQNSLVIVDPANLTIVARVPVGDDPHEVAVSDDGKTAYISNYGGGRGGGGSTIAVVDLVAQRPLAPIELGALRAPHGLAFAGGKLYFTAEGAKVVGRYDPSTRLIDWVMGTGQNRTHMVTVARDLRTVFTSNVSSSTVSVIEQSAAQGPGGGRGPGGPGGPGAANGPRGRGGADGRSGARTDLLARAGKAGQVPEMDRVAAKARTDPLDRAARAGQVLQMDRLAGAALAALAEPAAQTELTDPLDRAVPAALACRAAQASQMALVAAAPAALVARELLAGVVEGAPAGRHPEVARRIGTSPISRWGAVPRAST